MYICKGIAADEKEADREFSAVTVVPLFFCSCYLVFLPATLLFFSCCAAGNKMGVKELERFVQS